MNMLTNMDEVNFLGLNFERNFDDFVEKKIGAYIYILIDPRVPKKPFYIGKGGGVGQGNARLEDHFHEARKQELNKATDLKTKKIHEIWSNSLEVEWLIYPCKMANSPSDVAELIEGCLIQYSNLLWPQELTNKNIGVGGRFLDKKDILQLSAESVKFSDFSPHLIDKPIMLFPIGNSYLKFGNFDTALRASWKVSEKNRNLENSIAVGLIGSIAHHIIEVSNWRPVENSNGRFLIEGFEVAKSSLLNKDFKNVLEHVMGYWKFGCGGGGIIFKVDGSGNIEFLRGGSKKMSVRVLI